MKTHFGSTNKLTTLTLLKAMLPEENPEYDELVDKLYDDDDRPEWLPRAGVLNVTDINFRLNSDDAIPLKLVAYALHMLVEEHSCGPEEAAELISKFVQAIEPAYHFI